MFKLNPQSQFLLIQESRERNQNGGSLAVLVRRHCPGYFRAPPGGGLALRQAQWSSCDPLRLLELDELPLWSGKVAEAG